MNLFGVPRVAFFTTFCVELSMIDAVPPAGESEVLRARLIAATPATCGAAIEVPDNVAVAPVDVCQADVIDTPGA